MPELSNDPIIPEIPDLRPDPHILDYFALVARHKWAVSLIVLVSGCLFFAASYCVPYEYQADSMLLPPDRLSSSGMLSGYMSGYAIKILKEVENPSVDLLQNIIESRSMDSRLAEDSLIGGYYRHSTHTQDKLLAKIHDGLIVLPRITRVDVRGVVSTEWFSTSTEKEQARVLSARMANLAVWVMDSLLKSEFRNNATLTRRYADSDYAARSGELDSLATLQMRFEQEHGVDSLPLQTKEAITQMANLEAARDEARMTVILLSHDLAPHDLRYQAASAQADEAERAAREYRTVSRIGPSLAELPEVSRKYAEIVRRRAALEPIVSFLRKESEQQRMNEEREKSLLTILDPARAPDARTSPKRLPMLLIGLSAGLVLAIFYIALCSLLESRKERVGVRG